MESEKQQKPVMRMPIFGPSGQIVSGIIDRLIASMKSSNQMASLGGAGRGRNLYFSSAGIGSGRFKQNQRKERKRSRRRKMKPSAR